MPSITHVKVPMPRVVAAMSVQRVLSNALRFAENVPDDGLDPDEIDRRETVIGDLKVLIDNIDYRDSEGLISAMDAYDKSKAQPTIVLIENQRTLESDLHEDR